MNSYEKNMEDFLFREPVLGDGAAIYKLVKRSPPLDLNSRYCYLLLGDHFSKTCIVAEHRSDIVGFISAYPHPKKHDTLFVWQVVVDKQMRGRRLAGDMLERLLARGDPSRVSFIETTVTPSNRSSLRFFQTFADTKGAGCRRVSYLTEDLFGEGRHDEEVLLSIGPLDRAHSIHTSVKERK